MNYFYTFRYPFSLIAVAFFSFVNGISGQINPTDWQENAHARTKGKTHKTIPKSAYKATISVANFTKKLRPQVQEIVIPNPDGVFETFVIEPTSVVDPSVAHLYTIKTFAGYKKGAPDVLIACDISAHGFHAGVYAAHDSYFIEPANNEIREISRHYSYYKKASKAKRVKCGVTATSHTQHHHPSAKSRNAPTVKRTFKLGIIASGEYGQAFGGNPYNVTNVLNALASGVNMMNPIYLRDMGVTFTLVSNASMVYNNPATDPINTNNQNSILPQTHTLCTNALGINGFDVGHCVVWDNLGGLASFEVICDDDYKGEGFSGASDSNVTLWIDYVCHEIGHQFGSEHNFSSRECGTSAAGFRYEPGEGSSIMSYANVCGSNVQYAAGSDPYFHYASIEQMQTFIAGTSCAVTSSAGNSSDPIPNAQSDITIPKQTPFVLVGSATDANDPVNSLTYNWEQYDGNGSAVNGKPNCGSTTAPMFRFRPPVAEPFRSFPQYSDVTAGNNNSIDWEKLPCVARNMNFSMAVRDNNSSFGRVTHDQMKVTVANTGPFAVTAPNGGENLTGNEASTITWSVNGTNAHCPNVDILLSTDGGATYSVIADAIANDGSESITIPNMASTTARILIRCDVAGGFRAASTFYDVSNANFTITAGDGSTCTTDLVITNDPTPSDTYEASNTITSDKIVAAASTVNFYAGSSITLQPGFEVPNGATFHAKIQDCTSSLQEESPSTARFADETGESLEANSFDFESTEKVFDLTVYPNPVSQQLTIQNHQAQPYQYQLLNLSGIALKSGLIQHSVQLSVRDLPNGMYILAVMDAESGAKQLKKVVVQHAF